MELLTYYCIFFQASCVYDEYRYMMGFEGTEVEAYWEPNRLVARISHFSEEAVYYTTSIVCMYTI